MLAKYITTGLVGSALLATVAFAQTPSATSDKANANAVSTEFKGDWRASKVVGLNVYNDNNEKIGSINDLLMDKNGKINAAVIGVGGFLGVGEHLVAISFDKMKFSTEPASYTGASNAPAGGNRPASTSTTGSANTTSSSTSASKSNPWYPDHAIFDASKDDLKKMPEFKYSE
jgi:sporulation protein YlmC with PRC-barrel domain